MSHDKLRFPTRLAPILLASVVGCVSAPRVSYFTLDMTPSGHRPDNVNVDVGAIETAQGLSRPQIMIKTSPTQVTYYATADWVADIGELVRRKLSADLGPTVAGRPTVRVSGTLLDFEEVDREGATDARATLHLVVRSAGQGFGTPLLEHTYSVTRPAAQRTAGAVVDALSGCVDDIAAELSADLSRLELPGADGAGGG